MQHTEAFEKLVSEIKSQVREISTREVLEKLDRKESFRFVDVREDHEWLAGHARNAEHIGRGIIERDIEKLIPDYAEQIVLYCGGGYRSALAAVNIQKMGYTNVLSMAGGIRKWREENLPEEKPPEGAVPYTAPYAK
ncbi:MAG: sulfurtransferase [Candidatus Melainabacteria bacterium]|jgi:rhodanese-related sulfurtransferase|nr:sulfurtransferase [Candidatus Melainabacteria bacterium]